MTFVRATSSPNDQSSEGRIEESLSGECGTAKLFVLLPKLNGLMIPGIATAVNSQ